MIITNGKLLKSDILNTPMNMPVFAGAKDLNSRCIWTTSISAELFGFRSPEEVLGTLEADSVNNKQFAEEWIKNDKNVLSSSESQLFIEPVFLLKYGTVDVICTKIPLYDERDEISGIYWAANSITKKSISNFIQTVNQHMETAYNKTSKRMRVVSDKHTPKLTPRELDVLFYTMRGKTAKAIAKCLIISARTVESHIENLKMKFACHTKQQLIECAITEGYLETVPNSILQSTNLYQHSDLLCER